MIRKSAAASLVIGIGVYGLLYTGYTRLAMVLFSFGLFTVCEAGLYLFTGQCGFILETGRIDRLLVTLIINLLSGFILGLLFRVQLGEQARAVVDGWTVSWGYFLRSCMCGVVMFFAVWLHRKGTCLGILLGVPLFLLCGFQHSIANVIIMGAAGTVHPALAVCVVGNWVGSLTAWCLCGRKGKH